MRRSTLTISALILILALSQVAPAAEAERVDEQVTQGALRLQQKDGRIVECPLLHTDVKADIAGFIARVRVKQSFHNPTNEKIEAVYVFPLPHEAAVDDMTMVIGDRRIVGIIRKRAEARSIYEQALSQGHTAALLEQERPNIFTQSVGNIEPGQKIDIEISYVDVLAYDMGSYEFRFPMVVGPRYNPGQPTGSAPQPNAELQGKVAPMDAATDRVPDAHRINPPVLKPGERTGHDISLSVNLDAGVSVTGLDSTNHIIDQQKQSDSRYTLAIHKSDTLPNKDFALRYKVMGEKPGIAMLAHQPTDPKVALLKPGQQLEGYFMLMVQPREDERMKQQPPREIVFLVDVSGSMSGQPTEKVKEAMKSMLQLCRADRDTMQVITFASQTQKLFEKAVPVTQENTAKALGFTDRITGSGGTNMLEGVKAAIDAPLDPERLRIVIMLTDGFIGNEMEIIEHVGAHCGDKVRFWCIGVGSSVNGMLVEGVARQGGGMGKILGLNDDAVPLTQEVMTRIQRAQLAEVTIDWGGLKVSETYPARIPDLWSGRPIIVFGRYTHQPILPNMDYQPAPITVRGRIEGEPAAFPLVVDLPAHEAANAQLATVWARKKIEDLMHQTYYAGSPAVEEMVTQIALEHRLMSQYTSFVAIDEKELDKLEASPKPPRRMLVPVPLPAGTRFEGFFGPDGENDGDPAIVALKNEAGQDFLLDAVVSLRESREKLVAMEQALSPVSPAVPQPLTRGAGGAMVGPKASFYGSSGHRRDLRGSVEVSSSWRPVAADAKYRRADASARPRRLHAEARQVQQQAAQQMAVPTTQPLDAQAATEVWTQAAAAFEAGRLDEARDGYVRAYFLGQADYYLDGEEWDQPRYAEPALRAIEAIHARQVEAWRKDLPALGKRLDLVIRDQSLAAAIQQVAKSSGVDIALTDGSLADVAALLGIDEARVSYLDLRHATLAEALDWLCGPSRLSWWLDGGRIHIASDRRRAGQRAWVYDVAVIAWPQGKDLPAQPEQPKETQQDVLQPAEGAPPAEVKQPLDPITAELLRFSDAVKKQLGEDVAVAWVGDGKLAIIADAATHAKAGSLFAQLADPKASFEGELAELHKKTGARAEARKDAVAKQKQAAELYAVAARMDQYTWPLLAAALNGEVDDEALTELSIAWKSPRVKELADGAGAVVAMRSLWAINQASRAVQQDARLQSLWQSARPYWIRGWGAAASNHQALLYALMVDEQVAQPPTPRMLGEQAPPDLRTLAEALLHEPSADRSAALVGLIGADVTRLTGEDLVVLTAVAARKAGGEAWEAFRERQQELLRNQPLPGSVVVLVNRLAGARLPVASAR